MEAVGNSCILTSSFAIIAKEFPERVRINILLLHLIVNERSEIQVMLYKPNQRPSGTDQISDISSSNFEHRVATVKAQV